MPIYHYPGYITKEEAAKIWQVQLRTINDWIRKTTPAPATFTFANVDGCGTSCAFYCPAQRYFLKRVGMGKQPC